MPSLEAEHAFWRMKRTGSFALSHYGASCGQGNPRPESYPEDIAVMALGRNDLLRHIEAAAESGWDFSSRWFCGKGALPSTATADFYPADLNAVMMRFELNMCDFYRILQKVKKAEHYREAAVLRARAITSYLWSDDADRWKDKSPFLDTGPCASDYVPLWAFSKLLSYINEAPLRAQILDHLSRASASLQKSPLVADGGVQTTLVKSGQQWDAPNAWAPLQFFLVDGLSSLDDRNSMDLAQRIASSFLRTCFNVWKTSGFMHEKYNAASACAGGGGEYEPQIGFGWTNGVCLDFMINRGVEI